MLIIAPMVLGRALTWPEHATVVGLSLIASTLTYLAIEKPFRSLNMPNLRWFATGAVLSGTTVAAAALVLGSIPSFVGKGGAVSIVQAGTPTPQVIKQMQQAVATGINTMAAPSNLTPQPAHAHDDVPASSSNGCHAGYLAITQGPCIYGDPSGQQTVVLFGDSHMQQWEPAFANAGIEAHWRVINWTKSACPPARLTVFNTALKRSYTECDTWRAPRSNGSRRSSRTSSS